MAHYTLKQLLHDKQIPQTAEIVVIGAGMAGLYTTWRILKENPGQEIFIFDRLNRTGGRLDSDLVKFKDGDFVKEEQGGMRFTFENMDNLMSLLLMMRIDDQVVPFPMDSGGNNRLYFRGKSFTNSDAKQDNYSIWEKLYNLDAPERGINPKTIINTVFNRILDVNPDFIQRPDNRTPEFWQDFRLECQWKGVKLKDWTLWNLLSDMEYSNECITLLYRVFGFNGPFLSQMNAGVAYQLLEDFPSDPQFKTLENGFSTLPNALVDKIGKERIFLKTHLESIDKIEGEEDYTLKYTTVDKSGNSIPGTVRAKKVILCLPRLALEKLFINSNALNKLNGDCSKKLWSTLQTTTNQPLLKINLYYEKAWWGNKITGQPPVAFGPNFSDLPLGSVYPFYSIDDKEAIAALEYQNWLKNNHKQLPEDLKKKVENINNKKYQKPAALTIYTGYLNINFWKALQHNGAKFDSPMQKEYNEMEPQVLYPASEAVVREATKFFKALFNTHYVPQPILTSARIWQGSIAFNDEPSEQFGYGVHQWALQADDKQVMTDLVEPLENVYTCGEAYSDFQGWVEGALRSADLVLEKGFDLEPISKVYKAEYDKSPSDAINKNYQERVSEMIREYIDPDFADAQLENSDCADGTYTSEQNSFGVSLTYFDQK